MSSDETKFGCPEIQWRFEGNDIVFESENRSEKDEVFDASGIQAYSVT